ncbi:MAG: PKD domain-containing protein, partial [Bacteroidales bacterium]|nr:PKD domain-containing protein [Bacteroidales bacterium]
TVYNAYGDDTYSVTDMITVNLPEAPTTTGDESCGAASLTLTASGTGTLEWYDAPTEGTLVQTGTSLTDNFTETTTYFVQSSVENQEFFSGGNSDINTNGGNHTLSNAYYLIFTANEDMRLVSVQVNSATAGNRIIQLTNSSDVEIDSKTVNLTSGINTVTLDFDIPAGTDYHLKCGTATPNLYRNNAGVSWPYLIGDVASITGTNAGNASYYYYFYNWEVMTSYECVSARVPVTATINDLPVVDLGTAQTQCGGTVDLDAGAGYVSYEWNGMAGSQTYEVSTTGNYAVLVEDNNGCTASDNVDITINTIPTAVVVTGGTTQCGGIVDLNATGGVGGTIYWQGTTQNGTSIVTPTTAQSVTESGTYYFRSRSAEGCWGDEGSAVVVINEIPAAVVVSGGGTQCGGSMTLTASNGGEGTIYWQNTTSGGTSTVNPATQETISVSGTYYFRAQSAEGCWGDEGSASVTIHPSFTAEAIATDESAPGANDGSITVEMNGGTAPFEGTWTPSGTTNTSGTSMTLSGLAGGNYSVLVEDANGCTAEAEATVSTIGAPPVASFEADVTEACNELTVQFTDLSTNNPTSWAWNFGDGAETNEQNPTHTYTTPGLFTVSLTVENTNGPDTETIVDYIYVGESPSLEMSMTQETVLGNDGTATVVATGGTTPYYYEWNNGLHTATITGLTAGEYCVTVIGDDGCQASDCIVVTEEEPLTPPVANFSADQTMGCETLTVQFTDLSTNEPTSWAWDFGDGGTSTEQNPEHTYSGVGMYTVSLHVENADGEDDMVVSGMIYIGTPPTVTVDVTPASGETVADGSAVVSVTGGTAPFTITWSNEENGDAIDGLLPGNYSVMVLDAAGCIVTSPFVVTWYTGIADNQSVMSIYPNPARNEINVSTRGIIADYIDIVNVLGQSIMKVNPNSDITNINISKLEKGIYMVRVYSEGKEFVTKLIIQ